MIQILDLAIRWQGATDVLAVQSGHAGVGHPEHTPSEEEVTDALWNRFCEEADISVVSDRGPWIIEVLSDE